MLDQKHIILPDPIGDKKRHSQITVPVAVMESPDSAFGHVFQGMGDHIGKGK